MKSKTLIVTTLVYALLIPGVYAQEDVPVQTATQEEEAPAQPITYDSPLAEAVALPATINGRMLEGDIATIPADIEKLTSFVKESNMSKEQKDRTLVLLEKMALFFSVENNGEVTPTDFLLANNEVFKELNAYNYQENPDIKTPAYMYQLQYEARKLQYQVLEGDWKHIEDTADNLIDLVSDIYRNLEDPSVWQKRIRPINNQLQEGVENKDTTKVYAAGQAYLSAAPLIETATLKKIEKEEKVKEEKKQKNNKILFTILGILAVLGVLLFIRKRMA